MKIYKWLRGLMKASALTTVMFIMQACYGTPRDFGVVEIRISGYVTDKVTGKPLQGIQLDTYHLNYDTDHISGTTDENGYFEVLQWTNSEMVSTLSINVTDSEGNYQPFDTLVSLDSDHTGLKIKLERQPAE
jgi:hypothetical protein